MKRIILLLTCGLISALSAANQPNIILFVTDDESPIAGCYGNKVIQTPQLDALAAEGTLFTEAFATTASCSASRSVILTGIHNHANGQFGHAHDYHKFSTFESMAAISLPLQLSLNGYRTAQMGKYHVAPESVYHFDQYLKGRNPVGMAEGARALIESKDEGPFFLYLAYKQPYPFASDLWVASSWQAQYQLGKDAKYGNRTVGSYTDRPAFELYDVSKDPSESNNLAENPEFEEVLKTYQTKLKKSQKETRDPWVMKWRYE